MSIKADIAFDGILSTLCETKRKKIDRLQKSVFSLNAESAEFSIQWYNTNERITFSHEEIHSAIKRIEKDENEFLNSFVIIEAEKPDGFQSLYTQKDIDDNNSFVVPDDNFNGYYAIIETSEEGTEIFMSEDLEEKVIAELYYRRATKVLSNILSKFFEFRKLITAESPIRKITYKYFDLIFSLKKEVALKTALITHFFNELFYSGENEKIYFGNIQVAGRT